MICSKYYTINWNSIISGGDEKIVYYNIVTG